jgi:hypothetical protein
VQSGPGGTPTGPAQLSFFSGLSLFSGSGERAKISLAPSVVERLDALINQHTVADDRYNKATQQEIDTENF